MNKNPQILYLSGLISEEQLTETSDFEHSMALAQKMQSEFETLYASLEECLRSCKALEKQAMDNHAFHDKTGMGRVDSQGVGDADYFEDVLSHITDLTKSLKRLFGYNSQVDRADKSLEALVKRLSTDVS